MPAAVADPKRSLDSEQISPATIAHHTVYEKTPNLHQSHICQWEAQPYLMDPLSRLMGKPPLSPWLSKNILPSTKAGNDPNSAISLTAIFNRVLLYVCNSLCFGVQKAKNGDRGPIVFTATLRFVCTVFTSSLFSELIITRVKGLSLLLETLAAVTGKWIRNWKTDDRGHTIKPKSRMVARDCGQIHITHIFQRSLLLSL